MSAARSRRKVYLHRDRAFLAGLLNFPEIFHTTAYALWAATLLRCSRFEQYQVQGDQDDWKHPLRSRRYFIRFRFTVSERKTFLVRRFSHVLTKQSILKFLGVSITSGMPNGDVWKTTASERSRSWECGWVWTMVGFEVVSV